MRIIRSTFMIVCATIAIVAGPGTTAALAQGMSPLGVSPGSALVAPQGELGFGEDYPYFAGYSEPVTGPTTIETTVSVASIPACGVDALMAGSVSVFNATYTAAAVYVVTECYQQRMYTAIQLVAPNGQVLIKYRHSDIGDQIHISVAVDADATHLTAVNLTDGKTYTLDGPTLPPARVAVGTVTGYGATGRLPIPDFGTLGFTDTTVNGVALGSTGPTAYDLNENIGPRMTTGPIHDETDFEMTFRHS